MKLFWFLSSELNEAWGRWGVVTGAQIGFCLQDAWPTITRSISRWRCVSSGCLCMYDKQVWKADTPLEWYYEAFWNVVLKSALAECVWVHGLFSSPSSHATNCVFVFAMESRLVRYEHMIPPLSNWLCYSVSANLEAGCHRTCATSGSVKPTRGTQNFSNGHEWGEGVHIRSELCVMWSGCFGGW